MAQLEQRLNLIRISHFCLQNFVHELSAETREELLVFMLSQGKGSLDFARNILRESGDEQYDPELSICVKKKATQSGVIVVIVFRWTTQKKGSVANCETASHLTNCLETCV